MIFRIHLTDSRHVDIDGTEFANDANEEQQLAAVDETFTDLMSDCAPFRLTDNDGRTHIILLHAVVRIECIPAAEYGRPAAEALAGVVQELVDAMHPATEPRQWKYGDPEPGPEVQRVRDREGDVWVRQLDGYWRVDIEDGGTVLWSILVGEYAPLTDTTAQLLGVPSIGNLRP